MWRFAGCFCVSKKILYACHCSGRYELFSWNQFYTKINFHEKFRSTLSCNFVTTRLLNISKKYHAHLKKKKNELKIKDRKVEVSCFETKPRLFLSFFFTKL